MKKIYFLFVVLFFCFNVNSQIINFPDANFKAKLLAASSSNTTAKNLSGQNFKIDSNNDGQIQQSEALQVSQLYIPNSNLSNIIGIEYFINLKLLNCSNNQLTSINLNSLSSLEALLCESNQLNSLTTGSALLVTLFCFANQLTSLNVNGLSELVNLDCSYNLLSNLNVSGLPRLRFFYANNNLLTTLNITDLIGLDELGLTNNQLTSLYLKNGRNEITYIGNNPNLQYVCADDFQIPFVQSYINVSGYTTCHVNSYCSFTPGGIFYTILGNSKLDVNNNGCDALDIVYPNLKFNITSGTISGSLISNTTGNYSIPVQAGTHTVTPVLENPSYFAVSPTTVNVTFPTQASPFTQNFCVTANGIHPDLEVTLLPINVARPGFDSTYRIIYKNKGNTTQSGNVNLVFNDAVLDLMVSNPVTSSQTVNNLSWAFTNLLPFETREILLTLKVNSPTQTPAVSSGYILNYTTTITSLAIDELPNDNTFAYNQTVVNSYDPNDKTCLEGATITPTKVGDYVHYMIRFENNGTANAQNIVVKDMIDLSKFDINSIVPIKGSHSFVTNITAGNKVEFIFQNINLPFSVGINGGFVAFKIKTKSTLVLGNTFTNNASIYFDYNFPIITNTATTTISAALNTQDFVFSNYFNLYPNPVENVLNISSEKNIEISSLNIYNALGQLVLVIPNAQNTKNVDVSGLTSGNYFIKVNSDKGTSNTKFIKK